jgi:hypothetical protein
MMRPNETADFSSTLLGMPLAFPVLLAPIGVLDLICPQGSSGLPCARPHRGYDAAGLAKPAITPATIAAMLQLKRNYPGGFWKNLRSNEPLEAVRLFINIPP